MKMRFNLKKLAVCALLLGFTAAVHPASMSELQEQIAKKTKERDEYQTSLNQLQKTLDEKGKDASSVNQMSQIQISIQALSEQIAATNKSIQQLNDELSVVKVQPVAAAS